MEERIQFRDRINSVLANMEPDALAYNESEFWMIQSTFEYIEYYTIENHLYNTALALRLARGLHDGSHRKSTLIKNGEAYRLPYVIHCLMVCRMLADLNIPISTEENDILLASALCHDMIEDVEFPDHGEELYTKFGLDRRVYETVKLVSKRKDFTEEEERAFFHNIEANRLALLVKLSDRCHNVEDLYNRSLWKIHEYIGETRKFFLPMCSYGMQHYPELISTLQILQEKMMHLTRAAEILAERYGKRIQELEDEYRELKREQESLRREWIRIWDQNQGKNHG